MISDDRSFCNFLALLLASADIMATFCTLGKINSYKNIKYGKGII
jgi:hypothetical protein